MTRPPATACSFPAPRFWMVKSSRLSRQISAFPMLSTGFSKNSASPTRARVPLPSASVTTEASPEGVRAIRRFTAPGTGW